MFVRKINYQKIIIFRVLFLEKYNCVLTSKHDKRHRIMQKGATCQFTTCKSLFVYNMMLNMTRLINRNLGRDVR